jgi:hypothetical protein
MDECCFSLETGEDHSGGCLSGKEVIGLDLNIRRSRRRESALVPP